GLRWPPATARCRSRRISRRTGGAWISLSSARLAMPDTLADDPARSCFFVANAGNYLSNHEMKSLTTSLAAFWSFPQLLRNALMYQKYPSKMAWFLRQRPLLRETDFSAVLFSNMDISRWRFRSLERSV